MANGARIAALAACIACMTPLPALAGPHDEAIAEIIDETVRQWSMILTCSVLDDPTHRQMMGWWNDELQDVDEALAEADVDAKLAASIRERIDPDALTALTRGDAAALVAFCVQDDWRRRFLTMDIIRPGDAIRDVIGR